MINTRAIDEAFKKMGGRPSYHELARQLGCSPATARAYVKGYIDRPSKSMLSRLAAYLGVDEDELYSDDEAETRRLQPSRAGALIA